MGRSTKQENIWEEISPPASNFLRVMNQKRFFIADFYCHEGRLIVELDGKNHDYQKDYDELRSYIINNLGIEVIRFRNSQIDGDIETVLLKLKN